MTEPRPGWYRDRDGNDHAAIRWPNGKLIHETQNNDIMRFGDVPEVGPCDDDDCDEGVFYYLGQTFGCPTCRGTGLQEPGSHTFREAK